MGWEDPYMTVLDACDPVRLNGKVTRVIGLVIESQGPAASVGELCLIQRRRRAPVQAEVVGFRDNHVMLMPLGEMDGIHPGSEVVGVGRSITVRVGPDLLGRVLDGLGRPLDNRPGPAAVKEMLVHNAPPNPLTRRRITEPLSVGIRAMDAMLTCGKGQRIGIFSGSGVGKSTTLGMIARNASADVNVIALVGERGREVRDFIERDLGPAGLAKSVVVAATSDQSPLVRLKGAFVATAIAEYFRDQGKDVILMMDSVTRFAMAQREVGLAIGEPPTSRGYTPSVFSMLPRLLERAGTAARGTITGLYTILVEGDDMNEPVADAIRAILDGHVVLSRDLAAQNQYPPVDVLQSVSRLMIDVAAEDHRAAAARVREVLATYKESEDLINIGAYVSGSNPKIDHAIGLIDRVRAFLRQGIEEPAPYHETLSRLRELVAAPIPLSRPEPAPPALAPASFAQDLKRLSGRPAARTA